MQSPLSILQKHWHHHSFRAQQENIIHSVLGKKDTLALLPTGGGKSLCFQIPGLINSGLCLVITPLIALMKDQVNSLTKKGIPALPLYSGMTYYEIKKTLHNAVHGNFKFLYLSPERLETNLFKEYLSQLNVNLIAVDEAHCISQWGYDFRPPYLRISQLRDELPGVPVLALTASATLLVQKDIIEKLQFKNYNVFKTSFERANLSYSAFKVDSKINKLTEILQKVSGSSIVYCKSRRLTKEVAQLLALQNISVDFYHAGLSQDERSGKQDAWMNNRTRVIVCTNAFGMGIDKPDVRTVVHYDSPDCLENYYQEAGRAGRDSRKAYAVLLFDEEDISTLKSLSGVRFPVISDIRKVYQALADYLQIPVGVGEGIYFNFNLNEFVKNFTLDVLLVMNVLKVLEQEEHLELNENIFLQSQANFTAAKELLLEFEQSHPQLEPVIKCLLRTYEGIYDSSVSINEKQIAKLLHCNIEKVKNDLNQLQNLGVIEYMPQKDTPQIHFLTNRASARFLEINHENYLKRKEQFEWRVKQILRYMQLTKECRSVFIARYFNDEAAQDCAMCDNCLSKKIHLLSVEEFERIEQEIFRHISDAGITVKNLELRLNGIKRDNLWKVIQYLQSEKKISIDEQGNVKLN